MMQICVENEVGLETRTQSASEGPTWSPQNDVVTGHSTGRHGHCLWDPTMTLIGHSTGRHYHYILDPTWIPIDTLCHEHHTVTHRGSADQNGN